MAETKALVRIDPQMLLTKAVEGNASIETLERLVALAREVREVQAREAWHEAMAEFQRRCPAIKKTNKARIETSRGSYSYSYAPLDQIMEAIRPLLGELGLSVSWWSRVEPQRVVVFCRIAHVLGYSESSGEISMPIPDAQERGGGSPAQRVGSALTYARRYSLLQVTGLAPEDDDNAHGIGKQEETLWQSEETQERTVQTLTFPFPDAVKGKTPAECDLATLQKMLPIFEKAANDPKSKWADQNKKLVAAIQEAIAQKTATPESPARQAQADPGVEGASATPAGDLSPLEQAQIRVRELCEAKAWTDAKRTVYCHKTWNRDFEELTLLEVQTLIQTLVGLPDA